MQIQIIHFSNSAIIDESESVIFATLNFFIEKITVSKLRPFAKWTGGPHDYCYIKNFMEGQKPQFYLSGL